MVSGQLYRPEYKILVTEKDKKKVSKIFITPCSLLSLILQPPIFELVKSRYRATITGGRAKIFLSAEHLHYVNHTWV